MILDATGVVNSVRKFEAIRSTLRPCASATGACSPAPSRVTRIRLALHRARVHSDHGKPRGEGVPQHVGVTFASPVRLPAVRNVVPMARYGEQSSRAKTHSGPLTRPGAAV